MLHKNEKMKMFLENVDLFVKFLTNFYYIFIKLNYNFSRQQKLFQLFKNRKH